MRRLDYLTFCGVRNDGMAMVAGNPRLQAVANPLPFDGQRMIVSGFEQLLEG